MMPHDLQPEQLWAEIWGFYTRSGYIRRPRDEYRYLHSERMDWEVRFLLQSKRELRQLQQLLEQAGFLVDEPFRRFRLHMQPLYGQETVEQFMALARDPPRSSAGASKGDVNARGGPSAGT
jgi:hypothetical protein